MIEKIKLNHSEIKLNVSSKREKSFVKIVNEYIDEYFNYCMSEERTLCIMNFKRTEIKGFLASFYFLELTERTLYINLPTEITNENIIYYYDEYRKEVK